MNFCLTEERSRRLRSVDCAGLDLDWTCSCGDMAVVVCWHLLVKYGVGLAVQRKLVAILRSVQNVSCRNPTTEMHFVCWRECELVEIVGSK